MIGRRSLLAASLLAAVLLLLFSLKTPVGGQVPPWTGDFCYIELSAETATRHVYGPVNTECGGCSGHTAPFGNWGVNSFFGPLWDGDQYPGWKED